MPAVEQVSISTVFGASRGEATRLGEGAAVFRADDVRDADGRLLPAPAVLLSPYKLSAAGAEGKTAHEAR